MRNTFATRGELEKLQAAVDRLALLLGEPEPGWDQRPVLQYLHESVHALRNEIAKLQMATRVLADQAVQPKNQGSTS